MYTSFARYFLIVTPSVTNDGRLYNLETYQRRGWCRLEQWARLSQRGLADLYLCNGTAESPAKDVSNDVSLLSQAMEFMHGEYTASDARTNLVDASLMLYFLLLANAKQAGLTTTLQTLVTQCKARRDELYPPELFEDLMSIVEQQVSTGTAKFSFTRKRSMTEKELAPSLSLARKSSTPMKPGRQVV